MNVGKTLFAQAMAFMPWKTSGRFIERHSEAQQSLAATFCCFSDIDWRFTGPC